MVPSKYLGNFWRIFEMPLINCEINLILNWSVNCVLVSTTNANQGATFSVTDTKLYIPVVILSTEDNAKPFQQLKSSFKRTNNWNKFQSKETMQGTNPYLNYLIDPGFQVVNRFFISSFESNDH